MIKTQICLTFILLVQFISLNRGATSNSSLITLLEKFTYRTILTGHIEKIDSCDTEYLNYVNNPSEISIKNFKRICSGITSDVRSLGKYLSGTSIFDGPKLYDLYKDSKGVCDGSAIEAIYTTLFAKYEKGCKVAIGLEKLENNGKTSFDVECEDNKSIIKDFVKQMYHNCATSSCKAFHCSVQRLVKGSHLGR